MRTQRLAMTGYVGMKRKPATTPIGQLLDAHLDREHISQETLARRIGVSPALVVRWRNGYRSPGKKMCKRIAEATGIPLARVVRAVVEGVE